MKQCLCEKCWKGYVKRGYKTLFGKRYPNCVKKSKAGKRRESVKEAERKMSSLEMQQVILLAKAMKQMPGSPAQKKIKQQINVIRKKLGQKPVKESLFEKVDKIGAIKKAFPWAKGKMMNVIQMAIEMDVDGLAGVMKNYKANPAAYKQFVRDMSKMKGLPDLKEAKGVEKIMQMANDKSFGKLAGRTVDGMTAQLFKQVYDKAPQSAKDKIDKMNEKQLYVFLGKLWNKFGKQVKLT